MPYCKTYDHTIWRKEQFWNEECDRVLKFNINFINRLYERYSAESRNRAGSKKFVSLEEFIKFCTEASFVDRFISERDPCILYNLSIMTVISELESEKSSQMIFVEFVEALGRIADKISQTVVGNCEGLQSKILFLLQTCNDNLYEGTVEVIKPPPLLDQWEE